MHEQDIKQNDDNKIRLVSKTMDPPNERNHMGESMIGQYHKECHTFIFRTHQILEKYRKHVKKDFSKNICWIH
jgi:ABC-type transporter MlaC component